jgi:hypothetical protein
MATGSFDLSDLTDEAVARSGGEASTAADVISIRRSLRLLTERWTAQGYNTWRIETLEMDFIGDQEGVLQLPDCVDDVINVSVSQTSVSIDKSSIRRISAAEYAALNRTDTQGRPSQWWLHRTEPPVLRLYPTSPAKITVTYVARPEEFNRTGDATTDVPGRWLEALTLGLALDLARKKPPFNEQLIQRLNQEYQVAEKLAQDADRDRVRFRYKLKR